MTDKEFKKRVLCALVDLDLDKGQLADAMGIAPESISRALRGDTGYRRMRERIMEFVEARLREKMSADAA